MNRTRRRRRLWALPLIAAAVLATTVSTDDPGTPEGRSPTDPSSRPRLSPSTGPVPAERPFPLAPGLDSAEALRGQVTPGADPPRARPGALRTSVEGGGNAYARGRIDVAWREGDDVRFGVDLLLPEGFAARLQGQVDLLRWDDYPTEPSRTHRSGVVVFADDRRGHLIRQRLGVEETAIGPPFALPEGRWFRLEVRQRLGRAGTARSEVRIDGRVVAASTAANAYGNTVDRVRVGLVAIDAVRQRLGLVLWLARPWARPVPQAPPGKAP